MIPVFIDEATGNAEEALASSEYRQIWDVVEALKSHDDGLPARLEQLRIARAATGKRVSADDLKSMNIHFSSTFVDEDFAQAFRTRLVENTTEKWLFWYGLLKAYADEYGDYLVSKDYMTKGGHNLGMWVAEQRANKKTMSAERRQRLDSLPGWSWDVHSDKWEQGFSYASKYTDEHGDCLVAALYETDDG